VQINRSESVNPKNLGLIKSAIVVDKGQWHQYSYTLIDFTFSRFLRSIYFSEFTICAIFISFPIRIVSVKVA